jgi:hypothetical protein
MSRPPFPEMDELLQRLLDDQIQPEEMKRLQEAMLKDPRLQDYYLDSVFACTVMRRCSQGAPELSESDLIQTLSGEESQSIAKREGRRLYSIAAVLILGALILASLSLSRHILRGPAIGTLAGAYETHWKGHHPHPGQSLYVGAYDLREGVGRMKLGEGTSLLLEAPCQIELKSVGEVNLRNGKLTVMVSPQAKGFQVRTPTAVITDLGTEFGVVVHSDGSTEAHVLKGHISVALDADRSRQATPIIVNEGLAAVVDASGQTIQGGLAARADLFRFGLPPAKQPFSPAARLNLADIVGGGDGRGAGTLDKGVDAGTGQEFLGPATAVKWVQRNKFWPTPQFRGVDGVFVPNGAFGPVVISSTGLLFPQCPPTVGSYFGGPANSGKFFVTQTSKIYPAKLDGIDYGTPAHPALNLHPNAGVTFDLDQIRRDNPDVRIERLTAVCGIPNEMPQVQSSPADVWVLLDGVVHLHAHFPCGWHVVEKINVAIPAQIRFLTLSATCSGNVGFCWIFLGDPFLEPAATGQVEATH